MINSAEEITNALFHHFNATKGYKYQLCNAYVFQWESDFFCIAKSGVSYEVEVKVSRSDFFADFKKKRKHKVLGNKGEYFVNRNFVPFSPDAQGYKNIDSNWAPRSRITIQSLSKIRPNKFLYAVPEGLIKESEVPEYAGLIYVSDRGMKIVKKPPMLHKKKNDFTKTLLDKYYWAYLRMIDHTRAGKNFQLVGETA